MPITKLTVLYMLLALATTMSSPNKDESREYQKGVKHLCDHGITRVPHKYVLPVSDRPSSQSDEVNIRLPVIDFAELLGPNRSRVLNSLAKACEEYGFFQLTNHNVPMDIISDMMDASKRFFELPFEERWKYMSGDMKSVVRYGTSFNQNKDGVFCWRDFLKLSCHPNLHDVLPFWPSSPIDLRGAMVNYAEKMKTMYVNLVEAIVESLGLLNKMRVENDRLKEIEEGGQLMMVNWYPTCPEPELTLGMPPHSDYGFLTILLQDQVKGLQIQHLQKWVMVDPLPNSFVINVGDHLEILSNGRYKSVVHRAVVNGSEARVSVASLHSLPTTSVVRPWTELVDDQTNPRRYMDTHCRAFFDYISDCHPKSKSFLDSRKLF